MPDLVNNNRNQTVFCPRRISAVRIRARTVKTDHRVFHPADRTVDRNRYRIRIGKCVARINIQSMNDRVCRIFFPERISLIRIKRHRHHLVAFDIMTLRVPDKFSRRSKGEIAHIVGFENPRFFARRFALFVGFGFFIGYDFYRLFSGFGLFQSLSPFGFECFIRILQERRLPSRRDHSAR